MFDSRHGFYPGTTRRRVHVLPATVSIPCPPVCPSIMATITRSVRFIGSTFQPPTSTYFRRSFSISFLFLLPFILLFFSFSGNSRQADRFHTVLTLFSFLKHRSTNHGDSCPRSTRIARRYERRVDECNDMRERSTCKTSSTRRYLCGDTTVTDMRMRETNQL